MTTWIALLRGVNVGGHNTLPMAEFRDLLRELGAERPETYIQSGNVAFRHPEADAGELARRVGEGVEARFGFRPHVLALPFEAYRAAMAGNPFPEADADPKAVHLYFLAEAPADPDLARLEALAADGERFSLAGRVLYLHAPHGIGRSKLAERIERSLGVPATARNWRSAQKILELAERVRAG